MISENELRQHDAPPSSVMKRYSNQYMVSVNSLVYSCLIKFMVAAHERSGWTYRCSRRSHPLSQNITVGLSSRIGHISLSAPVVAKFPSDFLKGSIPAMMPELKVETRYPHA